MKKKGRFIGSSLFIVVLSLLNFSSIQAQQLAFPGAEGYGKYTSGGRGGRVIEVTTLEDKDRYGTIAPGSFREAVNTAGSDPITIVFRVSGIIELNGELKASRSNMTIAGQTAPGDGICIKDATVKLSGENIIIRYIRFRPGDERKEQVSCLNIENSKNIIIDHCSMSWSVEENMGFYDNKYTTVQWCILSEALYDSYHSKGPRGYAGQWGGQYASYHHNLIASCKSRAPRFNGSHSNDTFAVQDFRNNVVYNYGSGSAIYGGGCEIYADTNSDGNNDAGSFINFVYNYLKPGPAYSGGIFVQPWRSRDGVTPQGYAEWYIAYNKVTGHADVTDDNWLGVDASKVGSIDSIRVDVPHVVDSVSTFTADSAYKSVLLNAGAIRPVRDAVDIRIMDDVENGTGQIIDSQTEVGGWPDYLMPLEEDIPLDTDHDGIPDSWEDDNSLDRNDPEDGKIIAADGYSNLEHYLNSDIPYVPGVPDALAGIKDPGIEIFPNPFSDRVMIENKNNSINRIEIYDQSGKLVLQADINNLSQTVNTENLDPGVYIIRSYQDDTSIVARKIIKL